MPIVYPTGVYLETVCFLIAAASESWVAGAKDPDEYSWRSIFKKLGNSRRAGCFLMFLVFHRDAVVRMSLSAWLQGPQRVNQTSERFRGVQVAAEKDQQ